MRSGNTVTVYYGNLDTGTRSVLTVTAPLAQSMHHKLTVAGNTGTLPLEMKLNQLAVFTRALPLDEIHAGFMRPLAGNAIGLNLLWRLDDLNIARLIKNSADLTSGLYDTSVANTNSYWVWPGLFYRAFVTSRRLGVETRDPVVAPGDWTHLAAIYDAHYGIQLSLDNYGDCGNDASLDLQDAFSVEAWIRQDAATPGENQIILSKFGVADNQKSYEFGLDAQNRPYVAARILGELKPDGTEVEESKKLRTFVANKALQPGEPNYLVGTIEIVEIPDSTSGRPVFTVVGQVYINGTPQIVGPSNVSASQAPKGTDPTYQLNVYGGTGSGRYKKGDEKVNISATFPSLFTSWRGQTTAFKDPVNQKTVTLTMPGENIC